MVSIRFEPKKEAAPFNDRDDQFEQDEEEDYDQDHDED